MVEARAADGRDLWQHVQQHGAAQPAAGPRDAAAIERDKLLAAQALLAGGQGVTVRGAAASMGIPYKRLQLLFNVQGQMVLGTRAVSMLLSPDGARFAALPRSLAAADARMLGRLLSDAGNPAGGLRQACLSAGMSPIAVDYLFRPDGTLTGRLDVLTGAQRERLLSRAPAAAAIGAADRADAAQAQWQPARARIRADRIATYLEAQRRIAEGETLGEVARSLDLGSTTLDNLFRSDGCLLLTPQAESRLVGGNEVQRQAREALPRALRRKDLDQVIRLLQQQAGQSPLELQAAAVQAGIPAPVMNHLFDEDGLREAHVQALPPEQRDAIVQAFATPEAAPGAAQPAPVEQQPPLEPVRRRQAPAIAPERVAALRQAQQLMAQGTAANDTAALVRLPASTLSRTFRSDGRLLVAREGEALLELPDAEQREPFEAMPRALRPRDLSVLVDSLRASAGAPDAEVTARAARAGVPSQVLAFLFGDNGLRADRLQALPDSQAAMLEAFVGRGVAIPAAQPASKRAASLGRAAQLLQAGGAFDQVAGQTGIREKDLRSTLDRAGRLLINKDGEALLRLAHAPLRASFEALPRALARGDLALLSDVLLAYQLDPLPSLRQAAVDAGVSEQALAHLFDGEDLRQDRLESLPEDQKSTLLLPGQAPPQLHGTRFVQPGRVAALREAQRLIADGMTRIDAAAQVGLTGSTLVRHFDSRGRMRLGGEAASLLRLPNANLRAHFEALPRALRTNDLSLLSFLLREHVHSPFPDLRDAGAEMGVGRHALDHLFEGNQLRDDRLGELPPEQVRALLAARAGVPEAGPQPEAAAPPPSTPEPTLPPASARPPRPPQATRPIEQPAVRSNAQLPGAAEIAAVLRIFREQPGAPAFDQARQHFELSTNRLLQWLARAGVSEQEARLGAIPDPAVLWQRLSPSGSQPPPGTPGDLDSFAASLQELLDSPAPLRGEAVSTSRKRPVETAPAGEPSGSRARLGAPPEPAFANVERHPRAGLPGGADGLGGRLPRAGSERVLPAAGRPGTPGVYAGLADPGTPPDDIVTLLTGDYPGQEPDPGLQDFSRPPGSPPYPDR